MPDSPNQPPPLIWIAPSNDFPAGAWSEQRMTDTDIPYVHEAHAHALQAQLDHWKSELQDQCRIAGKAFDDVDKLRARLAEVEQERDDLQDEYVKSHALCATMATLLTDAQMKELNRLRSLDDANYKRERREGNG